jgi:hypothetical protein
VLNKSNIVESVYLDGAGNNTQFTNTTSHVYGSMNQTGENSLLTAATTAALQAYNDASGLSCASNVISNCFNEGSVTNIASNLTITGGAGLNLVNFTNLQLNAPGGSLILNDPYQGATFVIDITGAFTVVGGATITEAGNLSNFNVLFNVENSGSTSAVCFSTGSNNQCSNNAGTSTTVQGIVLSPFRTITLDGAVVDGEVIVGATTATNGLTLTNNAVVDVPEPATFMLFTTGLASLGLRIRRLRRR